MTYHCQTPRLRLREFVPGDADFTLELLNSPGWLTFIGDRNVTTTEAARIYLEHGALKSYRENGFGLLMAEQKSDSKPIGMCGLLRRSELPHPDLGFALLPEFIGLGYGTEMARAALDDARERFGFRTVLAITMPENYRSIRVLEKTGFLLLDHFSFHGNLEELLLFENRLPAVEPTNCPQAVY